MAVVPSARDGDEARMRGIHRRQQWRRPRLLPGKVADHLQADHPLDDTAAGAQRVRVDGAPHRLRPEERRLLGRERDQHDRALHVRGAEEAGELEEGGGAAGVVVRAGKIAGAAERVVMSADNEEGSCGARAAGRRFPISGTELRDHVPVALPACLERLLTHARAGAAKVRGDVRRGAIEVLGMVGVARTHVRRQEAHVRLQRRRSRADVSAIGERPHRRLAQCGGQQEESRERADDRRDGNPHQAHEGCDAVRERKVAAPLDGTGSVS
jgi:hypothetical protein